MTEAEAKKILERLLSVDIIVGNEHEAVSVAINALEKQIAKDVYEAHFYREPFPIYRCPVCSNTSIERNQVYCQDCGQKLDWSEV